MAARRDVPVVLGLWLVTVVGQASVGPVADVKIVGGRVHIQATAISVSEILNRLSRTTGMKVVYDGAPPNDRVTVAIDASTETEALSRLLEGLGLTYAFKLDPASRHVETLFVTTSSSSRRTSAGTTTPPSRMTQVADEGMDVQIGMSPEGMDPANDPDAVAPVPDAMGMDPTSPGFVGGQIGAQGVPGVDAQDPAFPSAASFPGPPGTPGFPVFPGPVSYP